MPASSYNLLAAACLLLMPAELGAQPPELRETAEPPTGAFVVVEGHASLLSDLADRSIFSGTFGYAVRGGYRWSGWGVFGMVEHHLWHAMEFESDVTMGAVNIGIGCEYLYAGGFVKTSLALGPSILAKDTLLDQAGSLGLFAEFRPAGLRWRVHPNLAVGVDPIFFSIVAPSLKGVPLFMVTYRTGLYVEGVF